MNSGTAAPSPPEQQHTRRAGTGHQAPGTPGGKPARAGSIQTGSAAYYSQIHKNRDTTTQHTQKQSLTKGAGGMSPGAARGEGCRDGVQCGGGRAWDKALQKRIYQLLTSYNQWVTIFLGQWLSRQNEYKTTIFAKNSRFALGWNKKSVPILTIMSVIV